MSAGQLARRHHGVPADGAVVVVDCQLLLSSHCKPGFRETREDVFLTVVGQVRTVQNYIKGFSGSFFNQK